MKIKQTITLLLLLFVSYACSNDDTPLLEDLASSSPENTNANIEDLSVIDYDDLKKMESILKDEGYIINTEFDKEIEASENPNQRLLLNLFLKTYKVSTLTNHPNGSGKKINVSGALLLPASKSKEYRLVVVAPPTYTLNSNAPSNFFKHFYLSIIHREHEAFYLYVHALQAMDGYAVLVLDYPGFGDSFGECFTPYIVQKPMAESSIDLIKATRKMMKDKGYKYKKEILVEGYSQGGFVSTSIVRELETNLSHGIQVKALSAGGSPANLKQMFDIARKSKEIPSPVFFPYALLGYQLNNYTELTLSDFLYEPYASKSYTYYNGRNGLNDINIRYPKNVSKLFKQYVIADYFDFNPKFYRFNQLLINNSIKPWINKCEFRMYHGISDNTVYYQIGIDYAKKHNYFGGKVQFKSVLGAHGAAAVPHALETISWFKAYK